jgi:sugar lactone lactonase YvrE
VPTHSRVTTRFAAALLALGALPASLASAEETVFLTVPTVLEAIEIGDPPVIVPGDPLFFAGVRGLTPDGAIGEQTDVPGSGAIGLARDPDGRQYVGVVTQSVPFRVELFRLGDEGPVSGGTLLDTTDANFSIFGRSIDLAWGPDGAIYYTTPRLLDPKDSSVLEPAGVRRIDPETGISAPLISVTASATAGIGFDPAGTLWFGAFTSDAPVQVSLFSRDAGGAVTDHGVIFDTDGGVIALNGFNFDLAPGNDGGIYFTTTTVFDDTLTPIAPAAVRRYDVATGTISTVVEPGTPLVSGLALAEDGRIWFGSAPSVVPLVFDIARTDADGNVEILGPGLDTTGGLYSFTDQGLDLAVAPHAVIAFLAGQCTADLDGSGDVGLSDLIAVLTAWGPCAGPCPADIDGSGVVEFADVLAVIGAWGPCEIG